MERFIFQYLHISKKSSNFAARITKMPKEVSDMEENALQIKGRDRSMDVIRAFAIVLMVYGHFGGLRMGWPFNCFPLYSYHMPLFLFVSGYLFHDILFRDYGRFLKILYR